MAGSQVRDKGGRFAYTGGRGSQGGWKPKGGRSRGPGRQIGQVKKTSDVTLRGRRRTSRRRFSDLNGARGHRVDVSARAVMRGSGGTRKVSLTQTTNVAPIGRRARKGGTAVMARRAAASPGAPISRSGRTRYVSRTSAVLGGSPGTIRRSAGSAHSSRVIRRSRSSGKPVTRGYIVNRSNIRIHERRR